MFPINENINKINDDLLNQIPGEEIVYRSIDSAITDDEAITYPVEFLNSLNPSSLPQPNVKLKIGAPIIILRNLDSPNAMNDTRCIITQLIGNIVEAIVFCGPYKEERLLISQIPLIPSSTELPFEFKRLQIPVKLCFAMTVNKSQGQTFTSVEVDGRKHCFSHGMLY